ncbi:hypothetical protein DFH07DRAFT_778530 [Mycena maculata]|uniref:RNase H type-1 domain-containing protein n=1 Tax=Mycena maculata TaxID=230809 RepID=A0AAD7ICY8_9AGAR|nr:hypothetical protein DFH07DRAFT_778530 [Mycena maculata]
MVQNIKVNQREPPTLHKAMVRCLNKYRIKFETVSPSTEIQRSMPLWHYPGENRQKRQMNNGKRAKCMRSHHAALTIGDGVEISERLREHAHEAHAECECEACENDKERGCMDPHACATAAAARLRQILPKWIPRTGNDEGPNPEPDPMGVKEDTGQFQPPKGIDTLAQSMRTMTYQADEPKIRPDPPVRRRARAAPEAGAITVYIAGAVHAPPRRNKTAAAGLYYGAEAEKNNGRCIPVSGEQSHYVAELFAALEAVRNVRKDYVLTVISTQSYVQSAMNKKLPGWEHEGWVGTLHREVLRCLAAELKARTASTFFKVAAPGSPERLQCRQAAVLAKRAARAPTVEAWDLMLPQGMELPGLSLQGNLAVNDLLPRTAQFLWKGLHDAHRIGKYWTHIPECEDRAVCQWCETTEDLEHILVKCESPGQEVIWGAAKALWLEKEAQWPEVTLGSILGCGLAKFCDDRGKEKRGTRRLYQILMSESAYLIWKLRNDRVISQNGEPTVKEEILNKWKFAINQRLQVDITLVNRPVKGKRPALAPKLVLETWSGTLDSKRSLPTDWLREPRVLVGSRAFPQTQPRQHHGVG